METPQQSMQETLKGQRVLSTIVGLSAIALIFMSIYSNSLSIQHTKLQLMKFKQENP